MDARGKARPTPRWASAPCLGRRRHALALSESQRMSHLIDVDFPNACAHPGRWNEGLQGLSALLCGPCEGAPAITCRTCRSEPWPVAESTSSRGRHNKRSAVPFWSDSLHSLQAPVTIVQGRYRQGSVHCNVWHTCTVESRGRE